MLLLLPAMRGDGPNDRLGFIGEIVLCALGKHGWLVLYIFLLVDASHDVRGSYRMAGDPHCRLAKVRVCQDSPTSRDDGVG